MIELIKKIKKIETNDIKSFILIFLAILPSIFLKLKKRNIWCLVERLDSADDNGWIFFQWLKQNHPERTFYFIINKNVDKFNHKDSHIIPWGSFLHYIIYLASNIHIRTTFLTTKPNIRICSYFELVFGHKYKTVYLRHGISKDGLELHRYSVQKVRLFICGAKPEYDYINAHGGYPEGYVQYTGFARFDELLEKCTSQNFILLLPTWRRYLYDPTICQQDNEKIFLQSLFFHQYQSFIENENLNNFLKKNNLKLIFCMHPEFNRYKHLFKQTDTNIIIVKSNEVSIHQLLIQTSLLITDYSSVFFDAAYMLKPIIFYHFDYDQFRSNHFSEGYFSYDKDGMGPIVKAEADLIFNIKCLFKNGTFINPDFYINRCLNFFPKRDKHNCERIYNEIIKI